MESCRDEPQSDAEQLFHKIAGYIMEYGEQNGLAEEEDGTDADIKERSMQLDPAKVHSLSVEHGEIGEVTFATIAYSDTHVFDVESGKSDPATCTLTICCSVSNWSGTQNTLTVDKTYEITGKGEEWEVAAMEITEVEAPTLLTSSEQQVFDDCTQEPRHLTDNEWAILKTIATKLPFYTIAIPPQTLNSNENMECTPNFTGSNAGALFNILSSHLMAVGEPYILDEHLPISGKPAKEYSAHLDTGKIERLQEQARRIIGKVSSAGVIYTEAYIGSDGVVVPATCQLSMQQKLALDMPNEGEVRVLRNTAIILDAQGAAVIENIMTPDELGIARGSEANQEARAHERTRGMRRTPDASELSILAGVVLGLPEYIKVSRS